ncbi:MAG: pyridoxal phosphate-dependent aminotransferase [Spirochaetales bacterium]|nr:pyridoxal phosphate-dependent aminotransferase [Spirochaetales bacterium]
MPISENIKQAATGASFIRKMFEKGAILKKEFGAENVFDFSLGNPDMKPPKEFEEKLIEIIKSEMPGKYSYMPNAGHLYVRENIAKKVASEQNVDLTANNIIMTCGAGGGMNVILKTILNPGQKVLASTPCFMEYKFYAGNHGGIFETVAGTEDFDIDIEAMEKKICKDTAAIIINSPNNPSGKVYSQETINKLAALLYKKSEEFGREIYLISDEPYTKIIFDNNKVASIFDKYKHSIIVTSYSKELSIPGERIGYIAVNNGAADLQELLAGMILCNRILGFVNAPGLMQRAVGELTDITIDPMVYQKKRDILCDGLRKIGYEFIPPQGTFYLFPKCPGKDDMAIVDALLEEKILVVPGSGFSFPGHFRISFCVEDSTIERAMAGFEKAFKKVMEE